MLAAEEEGARIEDLEITLRSYPNKMVYGDPLYIELQIVNRGKDIVRAPRPVEGLVGFQATDVESGANTDCSLIPVGACLDIELIDFPPGHPHKYFFHTFLPKMHQLDHPFWRGIENRGVRMFCRIPYKRLWLVSDLTSARIIPRDLREMEALRRWSRSDATRKEFDTKLLPGSVASIPLYNVRTRKDTKDVAAAVQSGEIADLLQVTLRLQELESPTANREDLSQALVEWVKSQPDIKRQWLANRLTRFDYLLSRPAFESLKQFVE